MTGVQTCALPISVDMLAKDQALEDIFTPDELIKRRAYVLNVINKNFINPKLPGSELNTIIKSLDKYIIHGEHQLAEKILNYLRIVEEGSARDIKEVVGETKERVDKALYKAKNTGRDKFIALK